MCACGTGNGEDLFCVCLWYWEWGGPLLCVPVVLGMGRTSSVCACGTGNGEDLFLCACGIGNGEDLFCDQSAGMLCLHPVAVCCRRGGWAKVLQVWRVWYGVVVWGQD